MKWFEIRNTYPDQWLVVEALEAHTRADNRRHIERLAVVEINEVLIDTGSAKTVLAADRVSQIGLVPAPDDILYTRRS
jgi:hypothetical protein